MAITLDTPIKNLYGVGEKVNTKLTGLNIQTVDDLLYFFPRRYEDFSNPRTIDQLVLGEHQIIQARIISIENEVSHKKRIKLTRALVADQTGQLAILWFNQPFLIRLLREGTTWLFAGKLERDYLGNTTMTSPVIERDGKIIPIYPEVAGLSSKMIRKLLYQLQYTINHLEDWLPEPVRLQHDLCSLEAALNKIHFPNTIEDIKVAKKRLAFDELFLLLVQIQQTKTELQTATAPVCQLDIDKIKELITSLPFHLTDSQRVASWQIIKDIQQDRPMNRLLEGDVGSGKTVVGAIAAFTSIKSGYRAVWMAPTEILANQHYATCEKLLKNFGIKVCLLTGSTSSKMRNSINDYDLVIGTQAVIQDKVQFGSLGLVIIDEQHRFGVKQRGRLIQNQKTTPHFLAMTATPIPRTLALTIYGDLDISLLQTVPTGRKPIISKFVGPQQRKEAYTFIRGQIQAGRQAFVVCPLVEPGKTNESEQLLLPIDEKKAATAEYEKLSNQIFPDLSVGLLHGKMKPKDKEQIMANFKAGTIDILVSTAVIEVGIDIPNATVMMIEGADRFGLAQLHQFRGRVGRAEHQSYCFVFTDSPNAKIYERLRAFVNTTSGFEIAELDLELRGPGQLTGIAQSGLSGLKIASLSDIALIQKAKAAAVTVVNNGLNRYPKLLERVYGEQRTEHLA